MYKIFGVGNILLCDDGIGVKVAEKIQYNLSSNDNYKVIIAETDYEFALEKIEDNDFVIIIDSIYFNKKPGTVLIIPFDQCNYYNYKPCTGHEINLLWSIKTEKPMVNGVVIGIEIASIEYSLDLSEILHSQFDYICTKVLDLIYSVTEKNTIPVIG